MSVFAGEKKLFKGLYIEKNWDWSVKYPVIRISFGGGTVKNPTELNQSIDYSLRTTAEDYSLELS